MTIRDQISKIIFNMNPINTANDAADAILVAFPSLLINSGADFKHIAEALRDGARGDIWYGASEYGDTTGAARIEAVQAAMEAAAAILHKEEEPEGDDPVQAYLKRMAERGDDEAKSLLA